MTFPEDYHHTPTGFGTTNRATGFGTTNGASAVTELNVSCTIPSQVMSENNRIDIKKMIQSQLAGELAQEILNRNLLKTEEYKHAHTRDLVVHSTLLVASPGISMLCVKDDVFSLNEEEFNESDITQALLNTYPERFL